MECKRMSLIIMACIVATCLISTFTIAVVAFAKECDMVYNVDCGDLSPYCCLDEHFCSAPDRTHCTVVRGNLLGTCTSIELYGVDSTETELLRYFRDTVLSNTPEGKEIIRLYYQWSPVIVEVMEKDDEFKGEVKKMLDAFLSTIGKESQ